MIRPIVVVGVNRSGTKWVSNIICSHEDVIGVQSRRAGGILETNMLGAMQDKFDLSFPADYVGLIEMWSQTEFFRRAGIDKQMFYELAPRPRNVLQVFELLMDELARRNGKKYWVQKTHPANAARVLGHFTNARVVVTRRKLLDTVRSTVGLQERLGVPNLFRATYRYVYQEKLIKRLCRSYPVVEIRYESLKANPAGEKARLFAELGLDAAGASPEDRFPKDTSSSGAQRWQTLPPSAGMLVRCLAALMNLLPLPAVSAAMALNALIHGHRPRPLVDGTFGELEDALVDGSRGDRA